MLEGTHPHWSNLQFRPCYSRVRATLFNPTSPIRLKIGSLPLKFGLKPLQHFRRFSGFVLRMTCNSLACCVQRYLILACRKAPRPRAVLTPSRLPVRLSFQAQASPKLCARKGQSHSPRQPCIGKALKLIQFWFGCPCLVCLGFEPGDTHPHML